MGDTRITFSWVPSWMRNRIGCESLYFDLFIKLGLFFGEPHLKPETSLGPSRTCTKLSILGWFCQEKTTPCLCYQEVYLKKDCPKLCPISTYKQQFSPIPWGAGSQLAAADLQRMISQANVTWRDDDLAAKRTRVFLAVLAGKYLYPPQLWL